MSPGNVGNDVGQMARNVVAAFGRCDANLVKTADCDVGSPLNGLPVLGCVRAQKQTQILHVETIVRIMKDLIEVADAEE